jgi:hypothetical protein
VAARIPELNAATVRAIIDYEYRNYADRIAYIRKVPTA